MSLQAQSIFNNWINHYMAFFAKGGIVQSLEDVLEDTKRIMDGGITTVPVTMEQIPETLREVAQYALDARMAAVKAFTPTPEVCPGQIRLVEYIVLPKYSQLKDDDHNLELRFPLAVCLHRPHPTHPDVWHAWMALPNSSMASWFDMLTEEEDMPVDPFVGFISTVMNTYVYIPSTSRVLGQLSDERLAALRELHLSIGEENETDVEPDPGEIIVRKTKSGRSITTGTPVLMRPQREVRAEYKRLFVELQAALQIPAELELEKEADGNILFDQAVDNMLEVDPTYLEKTLEGRLQATQKGSYFVGIKTTEGLLDHLHRLDWELTTHPEVTDNHICLKAFSPVPGRIGVVRVDSLKSDDKVCLIDRKGTGFLQAEYTCSEFPENTLTHIVYAIIGKEVHPETEEELQVLFTVHPGAPVRPSALKSEDVSGDADLIITSNIRELSGTINLPGVTFKPESTVLLTNQDNPAENGLYFMGEDQWTRACQRKEVYRDEAIALGIEYAKIVLV
jgi:hypothetical protein